MIQDQLQSSVAAISGESVSITCGRGFSLLSGPTSARDEVRPLVDCPLCRRPVPRPGDCRDGSRPMAECLPCDLLFDVDDADACVRIPGLG